MNKISRICFTLASILLLVSSLSPGVSAQEELEIAGIPVKVIKEMKSVFKTQFIEVVIPKDQYSKDNLLKVWKYYCEKYSDKKVRLDLRLFTQETYEFNRQFDGLPLDMHSWEVIKPDKTRVKLRSFEAQFERVGKGALAYGGYVGCYIEDNYRALATGSGDLVLMFYLNKDDKLIQVYCHQFYNGM